MNNNDDQELVQKRELDEDEEMPLAEKDLAADAQWKKIQQNTFTRWCNEHLKVANKQIVTLNSDFGDGLRLISLVEVLSHKKFHRYSKRPTMRPMKLENVSLALKFLEDEGIKIVNIDSADIVDGRMKLILGLIWTLILHYSISMPMWEDEGSAPETGRQPTPKERLMSWINSKLPDNPIKNFTVDWNDGRAIGALVDAVAPGLCPDWEDWDPSSALDNAREAMKLAEDWLDVPQVLRPEDMVNPKVDDLSMMTYLSKFPSAKLKPNAPLRPRSNAKKVRAYGPGIEPEGNAVSKPTHFTIETFSAGSGKVDVTLENPKGQREDCQVTFNNDRNKTYTVVYTPKMAGMYKVIVLYSKNHIPKSPFTVNVTDMPGDAKKCSAKGPGLQPTGLIVGQATHFEVFTAGAGAGVVNILITDCNGNTQSANPKITDKGQGVYLCQYTATVAGEHKITVTFGGDNIPGSVFTVKISPGDGRVRVSSKTERYTITRDDFKPERRKTSSLIEDRRRMFSTKGITETQVQRVQSERQFSSHQEYSSVQEVDDDDEPTPQQSVITVPENDDELKGEKSITIIDKDGTTVTTLIPHTSRKTWSSQDISVHQGSVTRSMKTSSSMTTQSSTFSSSRHGIMQHEEQDVIITSADTTVPHTITAEIPAPKFDTVQRSGFSTSKEGYTIQEASAFSSTKSSFSRTESSTHTSVKRSVSRHEESTFTKFEESANSSKQTSFTVFEKDVSTPAEPSTTVIEKVISLPVETSVTLMETEVTAELQETIMKTDATESVESTVTVIEKDITMPVESSVMVIERDVTVPVESTNVQESMKTDVESVEESTVTVIKKDIISPAASTITVIEKDVTMPVQSSFTVIEKEDTMPVESSVTLVERDVTLPADSTVTVIEKDNTILTEHIDVIEPVDSSTTVIEKVITLPTETSVTLIEKEISTNVQESIMKTYVTESVESSVTVIEKDETSPVESTITVIEKDITMPVQSSFTVIEKEVTMPVESSVTVTERDVTIPADSSVAVIEKDTTTLTEFTTVIDSDVTEKNESTVTVIEQNVTVPAESSVTVITKDVTVPDESSVTVTERDVTTPVDSIVTVVEDDVAESAQSTVTVIEKDYTILTETTSVIEDGVEEQGESTVTVIEKNVTVPVESSISVIEKDVAVPVESVDSFIVKDVTIPTQSSVTFVEEDVVDSEVEPAEIVTEKDPTSLAEPTMDVVEKVVTEYGESDTTFIEKDVTIQVESTILEKVVTEEVESAPLLTENDVTIPSESTVTVTEKTIPLESTITVPLEANITPIEKEETIPVESTVTVIENIIHIPEQRSVTIIEQDVTSPRESVSFTWQNQGTARMAKKSEGDFAVEGGSAISSTRSSLSNAQSASYTSVKRRHTKRGESSVAYFERDATSPDQTSVTVVEKDLRLPLESSVTVVEREISSPQLSPVYLREIDVTIPIESVITVVQKEVSIPEQSHLTVIEKDAGEPVVFRFKVIEKEVSIPQQSSVTVIEKDVKIPFESTVSVSETDRSTRVQQSVIETSKKVLIPTEYALVERSESMPVLHMDVSSVEHGVAGEREQLTITNTDDQIVERHTSVTDFPPVTVLVSSKDEGEISHRHASVSEQDDEDEVFTETKEPRIHSSVALNLQPVTTVRTGFNKLGQRFNTFFGRLKSSEQDQQEEIVTVEREHRIESEAETTLQQDNTTTTVTEEIVLERPSTEIIVETDAVGIDDSEVKETADHSKESFVQRGLTTLGGKFQIMMSRDKGKKEDHVEEITAVEEPADTVLEKDDVDDQETEDREIVDDKSSKTVTVLRRGFMKFGEKFQSIMTKDTVVEQEEVLSKHEEPRIESGVDVNVQPEQSVTMVIESDFATVEEPAVFEADMVIEEEPSVNVVDKDDFNVDVKVVEDGESPSEMTSTRVSFVKRGLTSIGGRFSSMISRDKGSVQDQTQESTAEEPADIVLETDAANIQEAEIATDVNENERTSKTVTIVKRGFTKFGEKFQSMMKKDTSEIREQEELITVTEQPSIESAIEVDLQPEQSVVTVESDTAVVEETDVLETDTVIEEVPSGMIVEKEETISVEDGEITDGTSSRVSFVKRGLTTIGGKFQIMMSRDKKSNDDQVEEIAVVEEPPEIVLEKATINVQETENTLDVNASEETFTTVTMVKRGFTRFGEKFQSLMTKDTAEIEDKEEVITVVEEPRIESGIEVNIHAEPSVSTIESEMAMVEESDVLETDVVVEEPVEINIKKENFSVPELETQDTPSSPVTVIKSGFSKFGERFQSIITKGTTKTQTEEEVINVTEQPRFESGIEVNVQPEQSVTIVESDIVMVEEPDMLETEIVIEEEPSESIVEKDSVSVQESEVFDETSSKVSFVQRGLTTLGGKFQIMMSRDKGKKEDHEEEITAVEEPADTVLEKDDVDVQETEVSNDANASDVTSRTVTVVKRGLTEFKEKFQSMMTKETVTVVEEEDKEEVVSFSVQPTIESGIEVNIEPEQSVTIVESDIVMVEEPDMLETEILIEEEPSESIVEKDSVSVQESEVFDETSSKVSFVQRGLTTIGGKFQIMMSRDKGKKEDHVEEITAAEEPADTVLEKDDVDVHIEETEAGESVNTTTVTSRTVTVVKRGFTRFGEKFQSLMTKDTAGIEGEEEVISVSEEPRIESGIELNIQPEQSVSIVEGEFTLVEEPVAMETETLIEAEPSETTVEKDSISFQESEVSDETSSKVSFMQRGLTTIEERFHAMMSRNKESRENQAEDITVTVVDEPTEIVLEKDTVNIQETEVTNDVNARTSSKVTIVKRGITKLEETFHSLIGKSATPAGQVQEEVIVAQGEPVIERTILTYSEPEDEDETDFTEKRTFKVSFSRNISAEEEEYWKVIEGDTISIDGMKSDVLVQEEDIVPSVRDYSEPTFAEPMAEYLNSTEMDHSFEMIQEDMVPERQNGVFSLPAYGRRNTPVRARVVPVFNPKKAYVTGRGIQPKGIRVREDAIFYVHTKEAGEAELRVQIIGPGGINEPAQIVSNEDGTYTVKYRPLKPGRYIINVTYGKEHVMKSPFTVNISPEAEPPLTYVKAYGPGLESGCVGSPCNFTVETNGAVGALGFSIEGPSEAEIKCVDNGDGSCEVAYFPTAPGEYAIHITCDDEDIVHSPYMAQISPNPGGFDASKVKAYGKGVEKNGPKLGQPVDFIIDAKAAGKAPVKVTVTDQYSNEVPVDVKDNGDGTFKCTYTAPRPVKHSVSVTYGSIAIPNSPFRVEIEGGADKVKVYGPGIEPNKVVSTETTYFTIDVKEAGGPGPIHVAVKSAPGVNGKGEKEIKSTVKDNGDGTYKVQYTPENPGKYAIAIGYHGKPVPQSPIYLDVQPKIDLSKVYVDGLETTVTMQKVVEFDVITSGAGEAPLKVTILSPTGKPVEVVTEETVDGYGVSFTPTEEGEYTIEITFGGKPIKDSPFKTNAVPGADPSKCRAHGPGLKGGHINKPATFTIETGDAGTGALGLTVEGPSEAKIDCKDNGDGSCSVSYVPDQIGEYNINITFAEQHIPGSPFPAKVFDASKVVAKGPGLEPGVRAGEPADIEVDCTKAGEAPVEKGEKPVTCAVRSPTGKPVECDVDDNKDGTFDVCYYPKEPGPHTVDLKYGGYDVPKGKQKIPVQPAIKTDAVKVFGPGVEPKGVFLDSPTDFTVDAKPIGGLPKDALKCAVTNPAGQVTEPLIKDNKDGTYNVSYTPTEEGPHKVDVKVAGKPIGKSPYNVGVVEGSDATKCKAYGPGLEGGNTNKPCKFTVETKGAGTGGLGLAIEGPSEAKMTCVDNKDGTCSVEYWPTKPGDYEVQIKFADQHIPGSPFHAAVKDVVDHTKVKASGPGLERAGVRAGAPATFTVDATKAGVAPLDVTVIPEKGPKEKPLIKDNGDGTFECTYMPQTEGKCDVEVKYADKQIPQSPFHTKILPSHDASKVKVQGPGLEKTGIPASLPIEFIVDTRDAGDAELTITITDANGKHIKPDIIDNGDGTYRIRYTPTDVGRYTITVKYGGDQVPYSPYHVRTSPTGDASKVEIIGETITKTVTVHEETVIKVNSRDAGKGRVTATVTAPDGTDVGDVKVIDNGDGTFDIVWTCPATGRYTLDIKFGGVAITGGPFKVVAEEGPPRTDIDSMSQDMRPFDLVIPVTGAGTGKITGEVKTPSGKRHKPQITENKDGTIKVKYSPTEKGLHILYIKYNDKDVPGSPFEFHVVEVKSGQVTAYGPGLTHGVVCEPCNFTINTKDAGAGGLALAVEGPSKAEIKCIDNKDGTCSVSYYPTKPGDYSVIVKFADKHVPGSPFNAKITDGPMRHLPLGRSSEVPLRINETDLSQLTATIKSPSSTKDEPCQLKRLPNGNIGISFTPKETGDHMVSVKKRGLHVTNSPFKVTVGPQEIGDASKVKVSGLGIAEADAGEIAEFLVDTTKAGYGGLGVSIEGPSKADINCEDNGDGTCTVTYRPTEPGNYILNVKYADQHVPGSPFKVKVHGEGSGKFVETITRKRQAAAVSQVGSECELGMKIPGTDPLDMTAQVTNPAGKTEDAEIVDGSAFTYTVRFVPNMMGVHTVSVKHKGMHVAGSPFQFTVGPLGEGGAHKVHAGGPGLERGEVKQKSEFTVWTREAGPGSLSISVEGPAKAEIDFEDKKDGSCQVCYEPTEPGEYAVSIKYNDEHIPDSPYKVFVTPPIGDARRLSVTSLQETGLKPNQPASFAVQLNGAQGLIDAKVVAPSGTEDDCIITEISEGNYAVRFMPRENGVHMIHVRFKGAHIPGSPFRVRVGSVEGDPGMVHATGPGLESARTGDKTHFIVNTCGAGAGAMAITIDGPSKVKMDVEEVPEGYKCMYTPMAPGDYFITIKYAGAHHIVGSPFKVKVTGANKAGVTGVHESSQMVVETVTKTTTTTNYASMPTFTSDASKVTSTGMGLKKAFINRKAQFTVNASDAGNNMLTVGIAGPKTPCEEILVKHNGRNRYIINYILKEKGNYVMIVKWGNDHIPGSPFQLVCS